MNTFEEKLAYDIGVQLAYKDYMEKTAYFGAAKSIFNLGKWGFGFGKGTGMAGAANRTLGSAVGFGSMNTLSTTGFDTDRIFSEEGGRAFLGGAAGGAVFGGAMSGLGKATKLLNKSWASSAKNLSAQAKTQAKSLDKMQKELSKVNNKVNKSGGKASETMLQKQKELQESLKGSVEAYKKLQRTEGVGFIGQMGQSVGRNYATPLSLVTGIGGGIAASGAVQSHHDAKVRSPIMSQNNVFNPVS